MGSRRNDEAKPPPRGPQTPFGETAGGSGGIPAPQPGGFPAGEPSFVGWFGGGPQPVKPITRTHAIGSLIDNKETGHGSAEIIEAIHLVWSTANVKMAKGEDAPRVSMHEPSRLLIIKAPAEMQALASEVIANLTKEHEERLRLRDAKESIDALKREHARELKHLTEFNDLSVDRLKASYEAEIDKLRQAVQELETQNRLLQTERR